MSTITDARPAPVNTPTAVADPPTQPAATSRRRRRPTPALPTGRAVVGGLLVAISALSLFWVWQQSSKPPETSFVVARVDIAAGDSLSAAELSLVKAELPAEVANLVIQSPEVLDGAVALGPIGAGEFIQVGSVLGGSADVAEMAGQELSFAIEAHRAVGGRLRAGEHVDVIATSGNGDASTTEVVVANALVSRSFDVQGRLGSTGEIELSLVLATRQDVLAMARAIDTAEVTVVRTTRSATGNR